MTVLNVEGMGMEMRTRDEDKGTDDKEAAGGEGQARGACTNL